MAKLSNTVTSYFQMKCFLKIFSVGRDELASYKMTFVHYYFVELLKVFEALKLNMNILCSFVYFERIQC